MQEFALFDLLVFAMHRCRENLNNYSRCGFIGEFYHSTLDGLCRTSIDGFLWVSLSLNVLLPTCIALVVCIMLINCRLGGVGQPRHHSDIKNFHPARIGQFFQRMNRVRSMLKTTSAFQKKSTVVPVNGNEGGSQDVAAAEDGKAKAVVVAEPASPEGGSTATLSGPTTKAATGRSSETKQAAKVESPSASNAQATKTSESKTSTAGSSAASAAPGGATLPPVRASASASSAAGPESKSRSSKKRGKRVSAAGESKQSSSSASAAISANTAVATEGSTTL